MIKFRGVNIWFALFMFTIALNVCPVNTGLAQQKESKQEVNQQEYELEGITVTAEKREKNIQEIPASITALSEIQIEDAKIVDTKGLVYQVPNLHIIKAGNHGAGGFLSIRGIIGYMAGAPTVGFYVDDVYYSEFDTQLFDLERIEVLKGPQGTLYGRNTEAGVINIVTKKPGDQWEGKASAGYGNYNSQRYNASIGGPLVQNKLFFRLAGNYFLSDGYFDNKFLDDDKVDDRDDLSGRALLRWTPTDDWDITLSSEAKRYRDGNDCFAPLDDVKHNPHDVNTDFAGYSDHDVNGQYLRAVYNGEWFTLTSITGYRNEEFDELCDWDFGPADFMRGNNFIDEDTFSQEIRLASAKGSIPLEWLAGIYYFDEETDFGVTFDMRQANPAWGMPAFKNYMDSVTDTEGYAFFGQATYTFFEKLGLTCGLRYDHETKDFEYDEYYDPDLSMFGMLPRSVDTDATSEEWLPKFAVDYRWTSDLMTYATIARGYKSGGFNALAPSAADTAFDPEYTWNYELGIKSSWLDNRLFVNLAGFYIEWKDQQVEQKIYPRTIIRNAAESTSKGFEIEVLARPATGLEFIAGFGYTDAKFEDLTDKEYDPMTGKEIGEVCFDDQRIPNVPKYTYNLAAQYRAINGLFFRVDLLGVGNRYHGEMQTNPVKVDAYELVNARLGYEMKNFDVYLWANNLFDEEYVARVITASIGRAGDPQTFGITLTARF